MRSWKKKLYLKNKQMTIMGIPGTRLGRHNNSPITLIFRGSLDNELLRYIMYVSSANFWERKVKIIWNSLPSHTGVSFDQMHLYIVTSSTASFFYC